MTGIWKFATGGVLGAAVLLAACHQAGGGGASSSSASAAPASAAVSASAAPASAATVADSADAADVKAYLDGLYAHYKTSKNNNFNMFDTGAGGVFDADTSKLLVEDNKVLKGDVGAIDGDFLCDCQDFVSLRATVTVQSATATTAKAHADFNDIGMTDQGMRHADFDLVKVGGVWRIHDVRNGDEAWMRQQLLDEIKSMTKGGHADSAD